MTIKTIIEEFNKEFQSSYAHPFAFDNETHKQMNFFLQSQLSTLLDEIERENQELIGRHNARILNQFQTEMKPDMPLIAYDERVALIPAITKIAEETKKDILSTLNKYRV